MAQRCERGWPQHRAIRSRVDVIESRGGREFSDTGTRPSSRCNWSMLSDGRKQKVCLICVVLGQRIRDPAWSHRYRPHIRSTSMRVSERRICSLVRTAVACCPRSVNSIRQLHDLSLCAAFERPYRRNGWLSTSMRSRPRLRLERVPLACWYGLVSKSCLRHWRAFNLSLRARLRGLAASKRSGGTLWVAGAFALRSSVLAQLQSST